MLPCSPLRPAIDAHSISGATKRSPAQLLPENDRTSLWLIWSTIVSQEADSKFSA